MDDLVKCQCKGGCKNRRCNCLKNGQGCVPECKCVSCANPLNGVDVENYSACAIQNIGIVKSLSEEELNEMYDLPCDEQQASLRELLDDFTCDKCGEAYWYSFCWRDVVQDNCSWHCDVCGTCRDWREWHCPDCNKCTYGRSMACENCGGMAGTY